MGRSVILICGPPGAGKSTMATSVGAELGLKVFDSDDPLWLTKREFRAALETIGKTPDAMAVVIAAGATRSSRTRKARLIVATEIRLLEVDAATCIKRVRSRNRTPPSVGVQIAAVQAWWDHFEPGGSPASSAIRKDIDYGAHHKAIRKRWAPLVASGQVRCARAECGHLIAPGERWDLGHVDGDRTRYAGPEHVACNRATAGRLNYKRDPHSRKW